MLKIDNVSLMSDNTKEASCYDSDSLISNDEDLDNSRKKLYSEPVKGNKYIRDMKKIYGAAGKRQRNNNKRVVHRPTRPIHIEATSQRILSARNHKIADQGNKIHYLTQQIEDLKTENKTLKTQSFRQNKAINQIESKHSDLPRLLIQHDAEVLGLKELLRRSKDSLYIESKQRKERENEIIKLRDSLARANQLIEDKHLGERSSLQLQNQDLLEKLESKNKEIEELNRQKETASKAHKREMRTLRNEIKRHLANCEDLESELMSVKSDLKEKEKLIGINNIYSHRFKSSFKFNDLPVLTSDSSLDKLDLNSTSEKNVEKYKEEMDPIPKISAGLSVNMIDLDKIKEDIRQIIEEEILSGRIKALEMKRKSEDHQIDKHSIKSLDKQSNDGRSSVHDSRNTDKAVIESEIVDDDHFSEAQPVTEEPTEPDIDPEAEENERKRKQLLLDKLRELDANENNEETEEVLKLPYSYPHNNDYLANDRPVSEIENIPAVIVPLVRNTYKFSDATNNLHSGIAVQQNNNDSDLRRRQSRPSISDSNHSKTLQIELSHSQRNNSNSGPSKEVSLPPLNESAKKHRESELLTELFGDDFVPQPVVHGKPYPLGPRHSRVGSLLWENEQETKMSNGHRNSGFLESSHMEDIEQIAL